MYVQWACQTKAEQRTYPSVGRQAYRARFARTSRMLCLHCNSLCVCFFYWSSGYVHSACDKIVRLRRHPASVWCGLWMRCLAVWTIEHGFICWSLSTGCVSRGPWQNEDEGIRNLKRIVRGRRLREAYDSPRERCCFSLHALMSGKISYKRTIWV